MTTVAVIGAQYGSEGKGVIVHHLADFFSVHVRVGGPNAGHSFKRDGKEWKMRAVPCGWTNTLATLVIGRGAIVNPMVLAREVKEIAEIDPTIWDRLYVDSGAWCVGADDVLAEEHSALQATIGSTLEGVGAARISRIHRFAEIDRRFDQVAHHWGLERLAHPDTAGLLDAFRGRSNILLEGTQGCGLSLLFGEWPYVTSADTNAAQMAADCGIPPRSIDDVLLVARTFPIRVGGNSGPLHGELTWEQMSEIAGRTVREFTTVTGRLRRIGRWNDDAIARAMLVNGAKRIALMFGDYIDPKQEGQHKLTPLVQTFISGVESRLDAEVLFVGTGGPDLTVMRRKEWPW